MTQFLVTVPHTAEECMSAAEEFGKHPRAAELLQTTYWACEFGNHTAWTVAEFEKEDEARAVVPGQLGEKAQVQEVKTYSFEDMVAEHEG
jgi:hypothetical protein